MNPHESRARMTFRFETVNPAKRRPGGDNDHDGADADVDVRELEQLIRAASQVEQLPLERSSDFEAAEEPPIQLDYSSRKERSTWLRLFISIFLAVATGALFGVIVLNLFFSGTLDGQVIQQDIGAIVPDESLPVTENVDTVLSEYPGSYAFMLQYGVYAHDSSRDAAVEQLNKQGLPAAVESGGEYHVYAGIAGSKDEAELLAAQMTNVEVYIKRIEVPTLLAGSSAGGALTGVFLLELQEVYTQLTDWSVLRLQDSGKDVGIRGEQAVIEKLGHLLQQLHGNAEILPSTIKEDGRKAIQMIEEALTAMQAYATNPTENDLRSVQNVAMRLFLADLTIRESLQPAVRL